MKQDARQESHDMAQVVWGWVRDLASPPASGRMDSVKNVNRLGEVIYQIACGIANSMVPYLVAEIVDQKNAEIRAAKKRAAEANKNLKNHERTIESLRATLADVKKDRTRLRNELKSQSVEAA